MNPCVSIIVPVYNAQIYLHRCIDSILNQEFTDFELILVNDGSTDDSGSICDTYAAADSRIRVIHKENTGVSDTRNLAISLARGTWLQFLDSDDWITPDATKLFVRAATETDCDMVIADFYRVAGDRVAHKGDIDIEADGVMTREEFAGHMMENPADFYYGVLWNKLYRRELVEKYHLRMDERISWCEDFMFNLEYLLHANSFYALQTPIYYYVKRKGSLVSQSFSISQSIKMKLMLFEYYNDFYRKVYDEKDYEKKRPQIYRFLIDVANDGEVPLSIFPAAKKLGEERIQVNSTAAAGNGILMEFYRNRKLLERYLEPASIKHELSIQESLLLLYIHQADKPLTRAELADFMGISPRSLSVLLQKMVRRSFLKISERKRKQPLSIELLPAARDALLDFSSVEYDFEQTRFLGFSVEEQKQYELLHDKIKQNVLRVLG